jgi:hypothetical protein
MSLMPSKSKHTNIILLYNWDKSFILGLVSIFTLNGLYILIDILDKKALANTVYINIKLEWL